MSPKPRPSRKIAVNNSAALSRAQEFFVRLDKIYRIEFVPSRIL
jgi:hypothetical protein